jgi:hypothetical protein
MTKHAIGLVLALCLMAFAHEARAWTPFGTVEHVSRIEDVGLTTPDGDALYLAYKTSTVFFIGGVYLSNDGYVLGLRGSPKHYVDMPPAALLANFQKEGKLPDPLPPYHLSIADYLVGYSLWLVLLPLAAAYLGVAIALRGRRRGRHSVRP